MPDEPPKRRLGRPPLDPDEASTAFSVRLPAKQLDLLCKHAAAQRTTVASVVRSAIRKQLYQASRQQDT